MLDAFSIQRSLMASLMVVVLSFYSSNGYGQEQTLDNGEKSLSNSANQAPTQELVFFDYEEIPVSALMRHIFSFIEVDVIGVNQLADSKVSIKVKDVLPLDVAEVVLKCHGFKMIQEKEFVKIEKDAFLADSLSFGDKDTKFDTDACVARHLKSLKKK